MNLVIKVGLLGLSPLKCPFLMKEELSSILLANAVWNAKMRKVNRCLRRRWCRLPSNAFSFENKGSLSYLLQNLIEGY